MRRLLAICCLVSAACSAGAGSAAPTAATTTSEAPQPTTTTTAVTVRLPDDPCAVATDAAVVDRRLDVDGFPRGYTIYLPKAPVGDSVPAIVALHGFSSTRAEFEEKTGIGTRGTAAGLVVVIPQGAGTIARWNFTDLFPPPDDVSFLAALLDDVAARNCISGFHVAGFSNGAALAAVAACKLGRFESVSVVAGNQLPDGCEQALPITAFHARDDRVVPFDGLDIGAFGAFPGVEDTMQAWADLAGCGGPSESSPAASVVRRTWSGCDVDVTLYVTDTGGHSWPGDSGDENAVAAIDATEAVIGMARS